MHILIVTQYFWPENFRVNDLAVAFTERGHEVTVLTGKPNYPAGQFQPGYGFFGVQRESYQKVQVIRVPLLSRRKGSGIDLILNYFSFVFFASLLGPFLCDQSYDVLFVHEPSPVTVGLPAILLKKIKRLPILFWVLDLWPESLAATGAVKSPKILNLVRRMVKSIYQHSDFILVQSRAFNVNIEKLGIDRSKLMYFPNWAEDSYKPLPVVSSETCREFRIMFAGNVGVAQDFPTILEAAERLKSSPQIQWLIAGDGRMLPWVREQVVSRGLSSTVKVLGQHPVDLMPQLFASADAMLVTLKREPIFALTIPAKIQAYLACGRPIVAVLDGEGSKVIEEARAGLTCPAGDVDGLVNAVLSMYRMSKADREALGANGRIYYEQNFARNMLFDRLEGWMKSLASQKGVDRNQLQALE